jgi:ribosome-binding protein aMBF1 (putative translation factor)
MKSATLPPLRVEPELRRAAERLLHRGETLSSFVEEAVRLSVERRGLQEEFLARGLASAASARESGEYVPAAAVLEKLERRLAQAHKRKSRPRARKGR